MRGEMRNTGDAAAYTVDQIRLMSKCQMSNVCL